MVDVPCEQLQANDDPAAAKRGPCAEQIAAVLACEPTPTVPTIEFQF